MTMRTPEDAATVLCPFARVFAANPAVSGCRGPACMLWQWERITADHPAFRGAVSARMKEIGKGVLGHKEAVAFVMENRDALGIPENTGRGWCGAGGKA